MVGKFHLLFRFSLSGAFCSALRKIPTHALVCGTASASPRGANRFAHQTKNTDHKGRGKLGIAMRGNISAYCSALVFRWLFAPHYARYQRLRWYAAQRRLRHAAPTDSPTKQKIPTTRVEGEAGYCYAGKYFCLLFRFGF